MTRYIPVSCRFVAAVALSMAAFSVLSTNVALALPNSVPAVHGDISRTQLGDGTGVRVAIIDSGVDATHPALTGNDSQGNARLVAQQNWVPGGGPAGNTGDDAHGHGTHVGGISLSKDANNKGMAPDARFINARVLDNTNSFAGTNQVIDGAGWAVGQGAQVMNMSLNTFAVGGYNNLERFIDWAAYNRGISSAVCGGNIVQAQGGATGVRSPAYSYNAMAVSRTDANYTRIHGDASNGPTTDGRSKPDIAAPGTNILSLAHDWEGANNDFRTLSGCSMATPHVTGMIAQQLEYAGTRGGNAGSFSNPLVIKATEMTAAVRVLNKAGNAWSPGASANNGGVLDITQPLDTDSGAGQIDGQRLSTLYKKGLQAPGQVQAVGWDLRTINDTGGASTLTYEIDRTLHAGEEIAATLTWFRHVTRTDNAPLNQIDSADTFAVGDAGAHLNLDNLDLQLVKLGVGGGTIVQSISTVDNVEHFKASITADGTYALKVTRLAVADTGNNEQFGLAWYVPEPSSLSLLVVAGLAMIARKRRA